MGWNTLTQLLAFLRVANVLLRALEDRFGGFNDRIDSVALLPESVWRDYIEVIGVSRDWPQRLERQQVHTLVLDRHRQAGLIAALANHPLWKKDYSDELAEVWSRKQ